MTVRTKIQEVTERLLLLPILLLCCTMSLFVATSVRCHSSLTLHLYKHMPHYGSRKDFHWLGATHGLVVYLFVPLWCGIIDNYKLNYRICCFLTGLLQLVFSVLSAGLAQPGYLIITDSVIVGTGASITLSTLILVIDDYFPNGSNLRILATTMVQGTAFGTFFLVDAYASLMQKVGWQNMYQVYGISAFVLGLFGSILFAKKERPVSDYQPLLTDTDSSQVEIENYSQDEARSSRRRQFKKSSVIDRIRSRSDWKIRLLSLSQEEFDSSKTIILWLLERFMAALISDAVFLFLLLQSRITYSPYLLNGILGKGQMYLAIAFLYTIGSTSSYLAGGFLGVLIKGKLLSVYLLGALVNTCSLIAWIAAYGGHYYDEMIVAWVCGFGVGLISTFAYAASEEATGIQARSVFPFTKLTNGVSIIVIEIAYSALHGIEKQPVELLLLTALFLSMIEFGLVIMLKSRLNELSRR